MGHDPIAHIDRESIGRLATSALREKHEIPRAVVRSSSFDSCRQGEADKTNGISDHAHIHVFLSKGIRPLFNETTAVVAADLTSAIWQSWRSSLADTTASLERMIQNAVSFPPTFKQCAIYSMFDWVEHRVRERTKAIALSA